MWFKQKEEKTAILNERKQKLRLKIKPIITKLFRIKEERITPTANLRRDLNIDSLSKVELVDAIEETFDIIIPDEDAEKIKTIEDTPTYLEEKVGYSIRP